MTDDARLEGLARAMVRAGHEVVVFEKSRGLGGRMAARRAEEFARGVGDMARQQGPRHQSQQ